MKTPKTYKIEHISDLLLVPEDKIEECLSELVAFHSQTLAVLSLVELGAGIEAASAIRKEITYEWIDDGKTEKSIVFSLDETTE